MTLASGEGDPAKVVASWLKEPRDRDALAVRLRPRRRRRRHGLRRGALLGDPARPRGGSVTEARTSDRLNASLRSGDPVRRSGDRKELHPEAVSVGSRRHRSSDIGLTHRCRIRSSWTSRAWMRGPPGAARAGRINRSEPQRVDPLAGHRGPGERPRWTGRSASSTWPRGGGDVPIDLAKRARRAGLDVRIEGCDISPVAVAFAARAASEAGVPVRFFPLDALNEPLPEDYDVVMCSLFLHHLAEDEAVRLLRKMADAARSLILVNDLVRSRLGYWLAWAGCRLLSRSPIVHHDGPASVRAAFTPGRGPEPGGARRPRRGAARAPLAAAVPPVLEPRAIMTAAERTRGHGRLPLGRDRHRRRPGGRDGGARAGAGRCAASSWSRSRTSRARRSAADASTAMPWPSWTPPAWGRCPKRSGGVPLRAFRLGVRGRESGSTCRPGWRSPAAGSTRSWSARPSRPGVRFLPRTEARVGAIAGREPAGAPRSRTRTSGRSERVVVLVATGLGRSCLPAGCRTPDPGRSRVEDRDRLLPGRRPCRLRTRARSTWRSARAGYVGLVRLARRPPACRRRDPTRGLARGRRAGRRRGGRSSTRRVSRRSPGSGSARWQGTTGLTQADPPARRDAALRPGGRRRICRAVHRRGDRLGPGGGPGDRPAGAPGHRAMGASTRRRVGDGSTAGSSAVGRSLCRAAAAVAAAALAGPRRPSRSSPASPAPPARLLDHLNAPPPFLEAS